MPEHWEMLPTRALFTEVKERGHPEEQPRLAVDLKNDIPQVKGFSERNLQLMIQNQDEYPELPEPPFGGETRSQPVAKFAPPTMEPVASGEEETQIGRWEVKG